VTFERRCSDSAASKGINGIACCFEATVGAVGHAEDDVDVVGRNRHRQSWSCAQLMVILLHIEGMEQFEDGDPFAKRMEMVRSYRWEFLELFHLADCPYF
jgi:hypothetical protein